MNATFRVSAFLAMVYLGSVTGGQSFAQEKKAEDVLHSVTVSKNVAQQLYSLPLAFEKNVGQANNDSVFLTRASGYSAFFTAKEAVFNISGSKQPDASIKQASLHMKFVGSRTGSKIMGEDRLPGQVNYFIGGRPNEWHTHVPLFSSISYKSVYPGTDLVFRGDPHNLEFDFALGPHREISEIRLQFAGARRVEVTDDGELLLTTDAGDVRFKKPRLYQESEGGLHEIEGGFRISEAGTVGFWAAAYDIGKPLVIDPVMTYATYFSGKIAAVAVDSTGNIYLAGTAGADLPTKNPYQSSPGGDAAAFVTKLDPTGQTLIFSTFISGSQNDSASALAVDSQGNSYITGNSGWPDFPTTPGAFMTQCPTACGTFVAKFDPNGSLLYSTYSGGSNTSPSGIAVDNLGNAYIAGSISSNDLPLVNAFQSTPSGVFVQKLDPVGSQMLYSTYLGGIGGGDQSKAIAVDAAGSAYVTGTVGRAVFPTKNPLQLDTGIFFLTKFSPDGKSLAYSTLLGTGGTYDTPTGIAVDTAGNAYIAASISTMNYPLTLNAFQTSCIACDINQEMYVLAMNATGTAPLYATLLGEGFPYAIAVDSSQNAYVTGSAVTGYLPLLNNIEGSQPGGALSFGTGGAFVTKLNSSGIPSFSTYLTGNDLGVVGAAEIGTSIAVDADQNIYVAGLSATQTFPTVNPKQGSGAGFLAKISPGAGPGLSVSPQLPLVVVRNVSTETVNISNITVTSHPKGINLTIGSTCGASITLAPAEQCFISITYPFQTPINYANITISSNVPGSPQTFVAVVTATLSAPVFVYSPSKLRFPPEYIGTATPSQTLTVTNVEPLPVTFDGVQASPDLQIIDNCTGNIPSGGSCTLEVARVPDQSNSPDYFNIKYTPSWSQGASAQDSLYVSGPASSNWLWLSASSESFGSQYVGVPGMPLVVTLRNVTPFPLSLGNIAVTGPFSRTTNCGSSLPAYGNCRVAVIFVPILNGFTQGNLAVNFSGSGSPANVVLVGSGKVVSDLWVSPLSFDFQSLQIQRTESQNFTLTNDGTAGMTISPITLSDSRLSQTNDCPISPNRLGIGKSCIVTVTFAPTTVGPLSGTLTIGHSGGGNTQLIPLTGAGVDNLFQPYSLDFGTQAVGVSSATSGISLNDYGFSPITIQSVAISGDFQIANNYCGTQLAAGTGCGLDIVFTPTNQGPRSGNLTVSVSDGLGPHVAVLTGIGGTTPAVSLSSSSLSFTSQLVGATSQPQTVTLSNTGNGTLNIASIAAPSGFSESNTCSTSLAAGVNCSISVQFVPTVGGSTSGSLTITDDATGSPQTVALWGNAIDFSIQSAGGTTVTINAGQTATYNLQGAPNGGFSGSVSVSCSGAPKEATCGVSPNRFEILNQPVSLAVNVTTRAPSRALASAGYFSGGRGTTSLLVPALSLLLVVMPIKIRTYRKRILWLAAGMFGMLMFLVACGGGGGGSVQPPPSDPGTPAGTYPITVTATSGTITRIVVLTLVVK